MSCCPHPAALAGYSVHQGSTEAGCMAGKWWWTLERPGCAPVADPHEHDTADEAWTCAVLAEADGLLEP